MRPSGRAPDQMRAIALEPGFTVHAEGSCLISFGDTRITRSPAATNARSRRPETCRQSSSAHTR